MAGGRRCLAYSLQSPVPATVMMTPTAMTPSTTMMPHGHVNQKTEPVLLIVA